jgi:putative DNA primase/helicase
MSRAEHPLQAALDYAALGLKVLPILPRDKAPATAHGKDDASLDHQLLCDWFSRDDLNVGILTGAASRLLVVDVDPRNGGDDSLPRFIEDIGGLPETATVRTGGGGQHFFFRVSEEVAATLGDRTNLPGYPGIDVKCGGYVVAPPSIHPCGGVYEWIAGKALHEVGVADAPGSLITVCQAKPAKSGKKSTRIRQALQDGEAIPDGARNDTLFRRACSFRAKGLHQDEAFGATSQLNRERCDPPLDDAEVRRIVESAYRYDPASHHLLTDLGNARRLVESFDGDVRYHVEAKKWLVWNSQAWAQDQDGMVMRKAKALTGRMLEDAGLIANPDVAKAYRSWAKTSQGSARLKAMVELAQTEDGVPVLTGELDRQRHLLNVANGTVDLRTGALHPHRREDLITRIVAYSYDPAARSTLWLSLLEFVTHGDAELVGFLQRAAGYAATGETGEQCLFILYGSGANGKSTWMNGIRHVLGPYSQNTPVETLLAKASGGGIPNDIARLNGARFVTASETDHGRRMAESLVKQMTGGEPLTARFLFGEFFEFVPEFKLFIGTNHRPELSGNDPAIWRRIHQIPFTNVVSQEQRDDDLPKKLVADASAILAWIVAGAKAWYARGLCAPEAVKEATNSYRREMDVIGTFIEDICERTGEVKAGELYNRYRSWALQEGDEQVSSRTFGHDLSRRGIGTQKRSGSQWRVGIRIKPLDIDALIARHIPK